MDAVMPRKLKKWKTTRELGKSRYVIRKGMIGWAVPVGIFVTLFEIWLNGFSAVAIIINAIIWPIAGYCVGVATWAISERRYLEFVNAAKPRTDGSTEPNSASATHSEGQAEGQS
jgi:hypothetical protein